MPHFAENFRGLRPLAHNQSVGSSVLHLAVPQWEPWSTKPLLKLSLLISLSTKLHNYSNFRLFYNYHLQSNEPKPLPKSSKNIVIFKIFRGLRPLAPHQGFHPWTPLGACGPQTPCWSLFTPNPLGSYINMLPNAKALSVISFAKITRQLLRFQVTAADGFNIIQRMLYFTVNCSIS